MSDPNENMAAGFPDPHPAQAAAPPEDDHAGPSFQTYLYVFFALSVCTALSFVFNELARHEWMGRLSSVAAIVLVAIVKASLVASIFMHLKFDFGKLYCIILPVCILTVMMVIILSIDTTLVWHAYPGVSVPMIKE